MTASKPRIGFVGVGLMGHGMAKNLLEKGWPLSVIAHRNRKPVDDLVSRGAREAASLAALAVDAEVLVLCVTSSKEVEAIVEGPGGILEKGPRGNYPEVTLTYDPLIDPDNWVKRAVIHDEFRFTFQFAKRFNWLTLRFGIKESTGGIGADMDTRWYNRNLRLSADVFDATFDQLPRVKIAAAMEVFRHLYVLGGVDELLNTPDELTVIAGNMGPQSATLTPGINPFGFATSNGVQLVLGLN